MKSSFLKKQFIGKKYDFRKNFIMKLINLVRHFVEPLNPKIFGDFIFLKVTVAS